MEYFAFLMSWIFGASLNLGFKHAGVNVTGTSLHVSIFGWSPLCHKDCLVDLLPEKLTVFGGVVITATIIPHLNM